MSVHNLIAHFLKANNYNDTLKKFEEEHGHPISSNQADLPTKEPLQEIVQDRIGFKEIKSISQDTPIIDEYTVLDSILKDIIKNQLTIWKSPYPNNEQLINKGTTIGLVISSAILQNKYLLLSTAEMKFFIIDLQSGEKVYESFSPIGRVVIKKIIVITSTKILLIGMNGELSLFEILANDSTLSVNLINVTKIHSKLVTDAKYLETENGKYLITLGWDFLVKVFESKDDKTCLVSEHKLTVQGTCIDAIEYNGSIVVIIGKNDSTLLEVFSLVNRELKMVYKISLNDAEFLSSIFSARCLRIFENDQGIPLIAVATSHEPYMRLILVSLKEFDTLFKTIEDRETIPTKRNQILKNLNTMAPQDKYLAPQIEWRSDGSGIWVVGEDGILRGIDLSKEQVIVEVPAHKGKIKTFTSGLDINGNEINVSCGTDRDIKLWRM